jgi:hypothetical protein
MEILFGIFFGRKLWGYSLYFLALAGAGQRTITTGWVRSVALEKWLN